MRKAVGIELAEGDREVLERWSRSRSATVRLRERSRIVLMASEGMTNRAIIETHNENPRPFVWTKSAPQILEKVHRARKALAAASA